MSKHEPQIAESPVQPGDVVAGKYRVDCVLGSGGMGVVVAATHLELQQAFALKFILPEALSGKGNVERFMREARAVVRLKSEHVARVYDVGRDADDRPFMVLELLDGMDLAKVAKEKGALPVADAVEYILQACEALVEAHAAGIVHRDLKPQNLFVTRRLNGTPLVKVLDFGIAKAIGPGAVGQMALTDSAAIIGSPLYMAPEQMRSARATDTRSDVWSLGVILFELLGGQLPFDGETVTEVCIRVVNDQPRPLLSLRPALDASLVAIVMRCLEKEPEARWPSVSALASALEPFSRSAQQGGLVRPWRSFEDTQGPQANPFPKLADATGPSTPVTSATLDMHRPIDDTMASEAARPLVSTDSTWAGSGSAPTDSHGRRRPFSSGMRAAFVVALAGAAAVGGLLLGRGSRTGTVEAPATTDAVAVRAAGAGLPRAEPSAAPPPLETVTAPVSPSTSATAAPRLLPSVRMPRRNAVPSTNGPSVPAAGSSGNARVPATPATTHPPDTKAESESVSPNGAPILH